MKQPGHVLDERRCAVLRCGKRTALHRVKTFTPGLLIAIWLCTEHHAEHDQKVHDLFVEHFGVDFVDPERQ